MSALGLQSRINTRTVKKLEKPRPLKLTSQSRHSNVENRLSSGGVSVDEVMALADSVCQNIINGNCDRSLQANVVTLSSSLKLYGQQLETIYKDQLDRLFVTFRNGSQDKKLDYVSKLHLLELVELRGTNWTGCNNMTDYYRNKISHSHSYDLDSMESPVTPNSGFASLGPFGVLGLAASPSPSTPQPTLLGPGEILRTSGKFSKPTKIPNKNYCKDEVVIRNSDSGKVNPGAKERLVQITGPTEDKIIHARQLMEDTIRRNASPVRPEQPEAIRDHHETLGGSTSSLNSSASDDSVRISQGARRTTLLHSYSTNDASLGEYKYTVAVNGSVLKITGSNHDLVRAAKLVLDEHFSGQELSFFDSYEEELPSPPAIALSASATINSDSGLSNSDTMNCDESVTKIEKPVMKNDVLIIKKDESLIRCDELVTKTDEPVTKICESVIKCEETIKTDASLVLSGLESSKRKQYSLEDMLSMATSQVSREPPSEWHRIAREFPSIVKKMEPFEPSLYVRTRDNQCNTVITTLDSGSPDPE